MKTIWRENQSIIKKNLENTKTSMISNLLQSLISKLWKTLRMRTNQILKKQLLKK